MRRTALLWTILALCGTAFPLSAALAQAPKRPPAATPTGAAATAPAPAGRFQLVVVPGHAGSPFLLDTGSGCVWHIILDEKTKRSTFIEVDVENLHWSWGSGAQQILAARVDASNIPEEQKRALKQDIQKTGCGLSSVVLSPGTLSPTAKTPEPEPAKPEKK